MDTYEIQSRVDSNNASEFENDIRRFLAEGCFKELILDAGRLDYISSAGLRVLLRIKKSVPDFRMINVQPQVYEILEMTGFTQMLRVEKILREISIDGCPEIGRGAHGTVYRIAADTIVKVFNPGEDPERIRQERELSRWALVRGVPTAIPYDIVKVGEQYGAVFELLNARSSAEYIQESPENLESFICRSVQLLKQIHAIEVKQGELPDMREKMLSWAENVRTELMPEKGELLMRMLKHIPESRTLLHADFHLKNIMICEDELMLIDMDTLCAGDPIFDLSTIYNSYREFPSIDAEAARFLDIDVETAYRICDRTMDLYMEGKKPEIIRDTMRKAQIFGCVRIIDYMNRHKDIPVREMVVNRCLEDIESLL